MDKKELLEALEALKKAATDNPNLIADLAKAKTMKINPQEKGVHKPIVSDAGQSMAGVLSRIGEVAGAKKIVTQTTKEQRKISPKLGKEEVLAKPAHPWKDYFKSKLEKGCGAKTKFKRCMQHVQEESGYPKDSAAAVCVAEGVKPKFQKREEFDMSLLKSDELLQKMRGDLTDAPKGANVPTTLSTAAATKTQAAASTPKVGSIYNVGNGLHHVLITHFAHGDGLFHGRSIGGRNHQPRHPDTFSFTPQGLHFNSRTGEAWPSFDLGEEIGGSEQPSPATSTVKSEGAGCGKGGMLKAALAEDFKPKFYKGEIGSGAAGVANKIIKPANVSDHGVGGFKVAAPADKVKTADIPDPKGLQSPKKTT